MRLTSITISDLAAFSGTVTFTLHAVTLITGDHGKGKSSLLDIMAYAFGRRPLSEPGSRGIAHDASLIHGTAERGEAIITFDDGLSFRVLVTMESTSRQVKPAGGKKWNTATPELIDRLVNALSYDPFLLKNFTEKERVETLLRASPVTVTAAEFKEALGDDPRRDSRSVLTESRMRTSNFTNCGARRAWPAIRSASTRSNWRRLAGQRWCFG